MRQTLESTTNGKYHAFARVSVRATGFVPTPAWKFAWEQANFIATDY